MTARIEGSATPARLSAEERREQILAAAKEVVGERGLQATTIESVARRAGITRPIVYSHFGDLEGLLEALIERASEQAMGELDQLLPRDFEPDGAHGALLAAFSAYLDLASADPVTWALLLIPSAGAPASLARRIEAGRASVIGRLSRAVGGETLGELGRVPDPELFARTLSASADEAVRLLLTDPGSFDKQRIMAHATWILEPLAPKGQKPLR